MKWLADENLDSDILRGIVRRSHRFDVLRVQDVPSIAGKGDLEVLAWATANERILLTHDISTMMQAMTGQLEIAQVCAPIVLVPDHLPISKAIEDVLLLDLCSVAGGALSVPLTSS